MNIILLTCIGVVNCVISKYRIPWGEGKTMCSLSCGLNQEGIEDGEGPSGEAVCGVAEITWFVQPGGD